ncbi:M48 family metallopeptidase [Sediminitomix flava]|uniref:STE24 endopeptidase n=1 Tax=Sediminitomix flava TaxID=379075 RepID=A0A315ZG51_SEDFL|nr:M48 family metallopeptidase [Sediminitomix flava]PWJ44491.1 STE24 endopeptidase [Sediminitomix flava]
MEQTILYVILGILTVEFLLERTLGYLNKKNTKAQLPSELSEIYDEDKYEEFIRYSKAKDQLGNISSIFSFIVTILMLVKGFAWINDYVTSFGLNPMWTSLAFFGVIGLGSTIISLPFDWYATFVIEEKFGFNKTTVKTFILDKIKGLVLGAVIGGLLLSVFIWFYNAFPEFFWLYAWGIFMVFTLLITMFYTNWILPLFNKLTPLEDGELRNAIEAYSNKVDFPLKNVMVLDGSKRSTKANAFFSGLGKAKNIVLYDTLIEKMTTEEIVAVLAHEVGHYKKKHTLQMLFISAVNMLITLYVLSLVINEPSFSAALGVETQTPIFHLSLIVFSLLYSPISTITGLTMNVLSRKNEFEADAYARSTSSANDLISSLKKLSVDALSNLTPHPAYVFFHYTHPPLLQRMAALKA